MIELKKPRWIYILLIIGLFSMIARWLLKSPYGNTALMYVAVPYLVSVALFQLTPDLSKKGTGSGLGRHVLLAIIIMLASSAILFEGFICVLFFMPIYLFIVCITFWAKEASEKRKFEKGHKLNAAVWPLIVGVLAIEGFTPSTTFERKNSVTRTVIARADIATLKANMAAPISLPKKRGWFLSIFPLPVKVQAGTLAAGDIHSLDFIYKLWFFTNVKTGEFHLKIDAVEDYYIRTKVVKNTSYLASYLDIQGTEINFTPLHSGATEVALTVHYERKLDPAWYFAPLQEYAVGQSADYLIRSVIARE